MLLLECHRYWTSKKISGGNHLICTQVQIWFFTINNINIVCFNIQYDQCRAILFVILWVPHCVASLCPSEISVKTERKTTKSNDSCVGTFLVMTRRCIRNLNAPHMDNCRGLTRKVAEVQHLFWLSRDWHFICRNLPPTQTSWLLHLRQNT